MLNGPNGGYPIHLMTPVGDSGMSFLISGQYMNLRRILEPENDSKELGRPRLHDFGALTGAQTHNLMSHLVKWMSADNDTAQEDSLFGAEYGRDLELAVGQSAMVISESGRHLMFGGHSNQNPIHQECCTLGITNTVD